MKLIISLLLVFAHFNSACDGLDRNLSSDYTITDGQTSATVPFDLIDNRIFVNVQLNGEGPFRFILDSGGDNLIVPEVAARLKLKNEGVFQTGGVGESKVDAWQTTISQVDVGRIRATNQTFTVLSLDPIKQAIGFKQLDGLVGFQLFQSLVTKIDFGINLI
jgi:hypothetical protein